ncbi:MAG: hypothetical protein KKA07_16875 [Bacteroidetes bacterium]|nr:hypothetical protein [Bacteroidota bacterium]MBU1720742.1 hypothetical protein [Bacteroidota bacterium]
MERRLMMQLALANLASALFFAIPEQAAIGLLFRTKLCHDSGANCATLKTDISAELSQ